MGPNEEILERRKRYTFPSCTHFLLLSSTTSFPPPQLQLRCFRRKVRREISGLTLRSPALFSTPPSSSSSSSSHSSRLGAFSSSSSSSSPFDSQPSSFAFSASLIASQRHEDAAVRVARHFLQVSMPGSRLSAVGYQLGTTKSTAPLSVPMAAGTLNQCLKAQEVRSSVCRRFPPMPHCCREVHP